MSFGRGDMEPKEWFDSTDSPTALPSSIKTLVACGNNYGFLEDDEISIGDISIAFLKANSFSPEDRARTELGGWHTERTGSQNSSYGVSRGVCMANGIVVFVGIKPWWNGFCQ